MRELGNLDRREMGRWLNNRAENSPLPFRRRERAMLRFRQMKSLQKFASVQASISNHFNRSEERRVGKECFRPSRSQWSQNSYKKHNLTLMSKDCHHSLYL